MARHQDSVDQQVESARRDEQNTALEQVLVQGGIALALATIAALAFGWLIAGRVLKPIRSITAHARHASEATLSERIDLRGPPDELKELADTIDAMLARLEAAFAAQRRFSAEASHELRTRSRSSAPRRKSRSRRTMRPNVSGGWRARSEMWSIAVSNWSTDCWRWRK